jgi:hypothetical protein
VTIGRPARARAPRTHDDTSRLSLPPQVEVITSGVDKFIATENWEVRRYILLRLRAAPSNAPLTPFPKLDRLSQPPNPQKAAQAVKEGLDKKFGPTWQVCVGEGFGYDVTYNTRNMIMV